MLQYGSDEFAHDSPRYTSPAASGYYLGGGPETAAATGPGGVTDVWPATYGAPAGYQTYDPYSLPPEPAPECQGLPPMSSFRANGAPTPGAPPPGQFAPNTHQDPIGKALGAVSIVVIMITYVYCLYLSIL